VTEERTHVPALTTGDEISFESFASTLLRWRRTIVIFGIVGAMIGLAIGLLSRRDYVSTATFIPQSSEQSLSGLALAASQFGIQVPSSGNVWGPPVYAELLKSQVLLEPIALDTVVVAEESGRRVAMMDLLEVSAKLPPARRIERGVVELRKLIAAIEDKKLSAVRLTVTTHWPSVSLAIASNLLHAVSQFNLETRKSQAERALRAAEDQLQAFLQRNRSTSAPELMFQQDRLQREVSLRQAVYTSLMQNREEARIREVRDTPVLTILENPRLPASGKSRGTVFKALLGGLAAALLGALIAFGGDALVGLRTSDNAETRAFLEQLDEATPRFLRRNARS